MLGTFLGLETSTQGLRANQAAIETVSHNIDNANTPGFSRQRVDTTASLALPVPGMLTAGAGQIGTGVQIQAVTRLRDQYLDDQYRSQNQYLGQATTQQDTLNKISSILNEPSNTGLSTSMQNFWQAWGTLSGNPDDPTARTVVLDNGQALAQSLNQTAQQIGKLSSDLGSNLTSNITQANQYIDQIATLNQQIDAIQAVGNTPNDLMDQRDLLVDKLSSMGDVKTSDAGGVFSVTLAGQTVVQGNAALMHITATPSNPILPTELDVATITTGVLGGIQQSQTLVSDYGKQLDHLANSLATGNMTTKLPDTWTFPTAPAGTPTFSVSGTFADGTTFTAGTPVSTYPASEYSQTALTDGTILTTLAAGATVTVAGLNGLQKLGYSPNGQGADFFTSSVAGQSINASNIQVSLGVNDIATALNPGTTTPLTAKPGDGSLAIATDSMKDTQVSIIDPTAPASASTVNVTLDSFYQSVIGQLGVQSQSANQQVTNQTGVVQQIDTQRQSVSGVSIDQEMSNMVQFQQSYNASARVISAINEMLTTLVNLGK